MSGVVLPPFLSLPLSSQRTLCLGSFLSFLSVFSAGLPQLSGEREQRVCVFGWTLLWFYWYWHCFHINTSVLDLNCLFPVHFPSADTGSMHKLALLVCKCAKFRKVDLLCKQS
jgi:hypothetical protein